MADKSWKQAERRIAAFFGTRRTPLSGGNSGHGTQSDTLDPELFIEIKQRAKHTTYTLWEDTKAKAKKENKLPIVALDQKGKKGSLLVIHQDDLLKLLKLLAEREPN